MKRWLLYLESLLTAIIGAIIGVFLALITKMEGIFIDTLNIKFLVPFLAIMLTILGWFYFLFHLFLKSVHRAPNANTAFQRGAPMIKGLLSFTDAFFSVIIGMIIGGFLALIVKPEGIAINVNIVNIEFIVILLTILGSYYLLLRMKLEVRQLEDAAKQRSGAHR